MLPQAFATQTLTDIEFTATGVGGDPFLAALTTAPGGVPEPAAWALMLLGVAGLGANLRQRRAAF